MRWEDCGNDSLAVPWLADQAGRRPGEDEHRPGGWMVLLLITAFAC